MVVLQRRWAKLHNSAVSQGRASCLFCAPGPINDRRTMVLIALGCEALEQE